MPHTRETLLAELGKLQIPHVVVDHEPVFTVEQAKALRGEIAGVHVKNLFLKDKKDQLWLVVCEEAVTVDLKSLPDRIGAARLSFGKADLLREVLGVEPGSVTPFSAINDREKRVKVVLDQEVAEGPTVCCHPLVNTATVSLSSADLLKFLRSVDHEPLIVDIVG
ncbi:MAG: prolyl-tRNA synthetase associated domain-containing protein [Hyphomicrobiales bacterium]